MHLQPQLAQDIVVRAMHDVGRNLNLMDATGVIVASGDPDRIGATHSGAVEALRTGSPVEVHHATATEREGTNLPIRHGDELVGVVGITGPLDEVRPVARLVRSTVELLLAQEEVVVARARTESDLELLAGRLRTHRGPYPPALLEQAQRVGLDLAQVLVAVALPSATPVPEREAARRSGALWLDDRTLLCSATAFAGVRACIDAGSSGRSAVADDVGAAVGRAVQAVDACVRLGLVGDHDQTELAAVLALSDAPRDAAVARLDQHPDLVLTLQALLRNDLAPAATAVELVVHRNTLTYRLNRIAAITGRDPGVWRTWPR